MTDAGGRYHFPGVTPGLYSITAELKDFSPFEHTAVRVSLGRETIVDIRMSPVAIEERIEVTAETPLLDPRKIETGAGIPQSELEEIPSARDPWSILPSVPAVLVDRLNVGGSESGQQATFLGPGGRSSDNQWFVDGVEVTDPAVIGTSSTLFAFDAIEEFQVTTGGWDAALESPGVVVNLVTKAGTNTFQGTARAFYADETLQASSAIPAASAAATITMQPTGVTGSRIERTRDVGLEVGGPILRDLLWFWGAYGGVKTDRRAVGGGREIVDSDNLDGRLSAQPTSRSLLDLRLSNGTRDATGAGAAPDRAVESTLVEDGMTWIGKLETTHQFSSSFYLHGFLAALDTDRKAATGGGLDRAETRRNGDGVWRRAFLGEAVESQAVQVGVDGSYYPSFVSDLELQFGGDFRSTDSTSTTAWPGRGVVSFAGANFGRPAGSDVAWVTRDGSTAVTVDSLGLWTQARVNRARWTLQAGLRYDGQEGRNEASTVPASRLRPALLPALTFPGNDGGGFRFSDLSPRIGFTYDLTGSGKTSLRAGYSRFAARLDPATLTRVNPAALSAAYFSFIDVDGDGVADDDELAPAPFFCEQCDPAAPGALATPNRNDPGLGAALTDELTLGLQHAFHDDLLVELTATLREVSRLPEERDLIVDETGSLRPARREDYVVDRTLTGLLPDGTPYEVPTFSLHPGLTPTFGTLLTNGERRQEYTGLTVAVQKRYSHNWMLRGQASVFAGRWQVPAAYEAVSDPTDDVGPGDDDNAVVAEPPADGDGAWISGRWSFSLVGSYRIAADTPWELTVGAAISGREGFPNPPFERIIGADGLPRDVAVAPFDRFRLDDLVTADLRLDKPLGGDRWQFDLTIEALNLTNERVILERVGSRSIERADLVNRTMNPFLIRLGLRLSR